MNSLRLAASISSNWQTSHHLSSLSGEAKKATTDATLGQNVPEILKERFQAIGGT